LLPLDNLRKKKSDWSKKTGNTGGCQHCWERQTEENQWARLNLSLPSPQSNLHTGGAQWGGGKGGGGDKRVRKIVAKKRRTRQIFSKKVEKEADWAGDKQNNKGESYEGLKIKVPPRPASILHGKKKKTLGKNSWGGNGSAFPKKKKKTRGGKRASNRPRRGGAKTPIRKKNDCWEKRRPRVVGKKNDTEFPPKKMQFTKREQNQKQNLCRG